MEIAGPRSRRVVRLLIRREFIGAPEMNGYHPGLGTRNSAQAPVVRPNSQERLSSPQHAPCNEQDKVTRRRVLIESRRRSSPGERTTDGCD